MKQSARLLGAAAVALAGALTLACQNGVTGPTLSATIQNLKLQPTVAGLVGGENVCCCYIAGQATNTSSVTVHIEVSFPARGLDGQSLGAGVDVERDVPPGATRTFLAPGIQAPCKDVSLAQITADKVVTVLGLWQPPQ